ncbi:hypothetical protein LOH54_01170 [Sulfurimonas sp. HSL-3221]|uniref:hypothetical protein n=1 Tax=Sulfurimonadaceae TaxID=2771471 RepID=UPI001E2EE1C3|nr:hypothetical protein [Sulfurimonas sp. HSL-3221]UFS62752.1 hypothetical protein LOH54_01170 [Sulfurimonas sp. HSL-3221]
MTYTEFLQLLEKHEIDVGGIASKLGYSKGSIENNWAKTGEVPRKAVLALELYLELRQEKHANEVLKQKLEEYDRKQNLTQLLSKKALQIAERKSNENGLELEDYISSLIISTI